MSGEGEDFDLLAGIYVLGALESDEARSVEDLAARDPEVALAIEAWQNRLAPLADAVLPVLVPPELWARIETSIGLMAAQPEAQPATDAAQPAIVHTPTQPSATAVWWRGAWESVALWRAAAAAFAVAAIFAGFSILSRPEPVPYAAALAPTGSPAPEFLAQLASDGSLTVRPLAPVQLPNGRDMELWALPEGAKQPVSLGVLPSIGRTIPPQKLPRPPVQLLVSLEPIGGSPTGQPTGPVILGGTLKRL